jgi:hypothetical protein
VEEGGVSDALDFVFRQEHGSRDGGGGSSGCSGLSHRGDEDHALRRPRGPGHNRSLAARPWEGFPPPWKPSHGLSLWKHIFCLFGIYKDAEDTEVFL